MSTSTEIVLPPYPEGTPGFDSKHGSYWHKLSPSHSAALSVIEHWVMENNINLNDLCMVSLDHKLTLLRYLRANNFDTKKTITHMTKNIAWRKDNKVKEIVMKRPEEILGFSVEQLTNMFPHWHYGYDKTGRPVLYKQYGKFDATTLKASVGGNFDAVVNYHIWEQEACTRLCVERSNQMNKIIETFTGIIDVKDMRMLQITRDFLALIQRLAEVDQQQYPETLGRMYILNAPMVFPVVWRMVKPWLDPVTTAKIFVLGGPREYEPILRDFIGKENLPTCYGGDLPSLSPAIHPYTETMETEYGGVELESTPGATVFKLDSIKAATEMISKEIEIDVPVATLVPAEK